MGRFNLTACAIAALAALLAGSGEARAAKEKFDRSKPHLNIGTIGHVDHGKTTLTAAITKILGERGQPTFAPLPQIVEGSEDGAAGIVTNACDVEYETATRIYHHFDCGARENFVRDWIGGRNAIDEGAILVVSAPDGPIPQTREHVLLARQVGVPALVVFLNKVDLVDDEELDRVEEEIRDLLRLSGFPGDQTPFVKGDIEGAHTGAARDVEAILRLVEEMDGFLPEPIPTADRPFLMPVEDVFTITGGDTVATGIVEQGTVLEGDLVEIVGGLTAITAVVDQLVRQPPSDGEALTGDNIGALLRGVSRAAVERGQVLAKPGSIRPHSKFKAQIYVLDKDDGGGNISPFTNGYRPQFYIRTTDVTGTIDLGSITSLVFPGEHATMDVELDEPAVIEPGLRFGLGQGPRAIGIGVISETLD
jgi:elongation factor Tu